MVVDLGAARDGAQPVRVLPEQERTAPLHVDEPSRRAPLEDLGAPADRDPEQRQPVAEACAEAELGRRLDDPEAEPRRRDPLEVARVREEGERGLERDGDDLGALEDVPGHAAARWSFAHAASRPR